MQPLGGQRGATAAICNYHGSPVTPLLILQQHHMLPARLHCLMPHMACALRYHVV